MKKIRVLHLFKLYLHTTENWAFRLIDNLPDCDIVVASANFLRCNFYPGKFTYLEFPLKQIENPQKQLWIRILNKLTSYALKAYPYYIEKMCGNCDIMHSHFAPIGWRYLNLAKRLKIPHIVSFYGMDYEQLPFRQPVWKRRYERLFKEADMFLCEGPHGAKILQKIGCPTEKIRITRLGVDVNQIPFWNRTKKPRELKLLQIAAFTGKKGHKYAIEAFTRALQDCPNMTLTFVGPDRQGIRAELQRQIKGQAAEKIMFIDAIDFEELYTFMKDYHVFIHPSCYTEDMNCEGGAPVVLLDAQATGMPVISTIHCDIPDEVVHEKTGLLSPEKDIESLADLIKTFYKMGKNEYGTYAKNSNEHITKNYDAQNYAAEIKRIYERL
ncbi:glycosyltransferase family 4 protein [Desulfococcaceae bacterium HSG7]|nr:glycosyltransferase family 4 protein [Desulfococcaceae bacterium HSG7]